MVMNDSLWDIILFRRCRLYLALFYEEFWEGALEIASMQVSLSYVVFSLSVIRNVFRVHELKKNIFAYLRRSMNEAW